MLTISEAGKRIRATRKARNLSQDELARRSGVAQTTISRVETGVHEPQLPSIRRLAEVLDVPVKELVG